MYVRLTLDCGAFYTDVVRASYLYTEVGYFDPHIFVYCAGELIDGPQIPREKRMIHVVRTNNDGTENLEGISFSKTFQDSVVRLSNLYGEDVLVDPNQFDCVFRFTSGHFRESKMREGNWGENSTSGGATGHVMKTRSQAEDVIVEYVLGHGETLKLVSGGQLLWSSGNLGIEADRVDLEVNVDPETAIKFYASALAPRRNCYWIPRSFIPPPYVAYKGE
jgi:hypothetical protein